MSGSFDVIAFIDVFFSLKDVSEDNEVESSAAAFVLHFVETIESDKVGMRIISDMVSVVCQ